MLFTYFFGLHSRAYHEWVFANQLVVIALLMVVTRKLTQSAMAAFLAPILWMCSIAVATPLAWAERRGHQQVASILRAHGATK